MMKTINYGKQTINNNDIKEVVKTLKSNYLTTGSKIEEFEKALCKYLGCKYAVVVSSGTAALHLAIKVLDIDYKEAMLSPMTFCATSNALLYNNVNPIFIDIKENGLIDENKLFITIANYLIIPIHYGGNCCNMKFIKYLADRYNLKVIEDGCHALGSKYKGHKIGDCKYSDMCCFSFHPVKAITTGEGGAITTNSKELYEKLKSLRNHGMIKGDMKDLGFNYRLNDIQCALGISQLKRINSFIKRRREIAKRYDKAFKNDKDIEVIKEEKDSFNSYHLYVIKLKNKKVRDNLFNYLKKFNINCQIHYKPVYFHSYYKENKIHNVEKSLYDKETEDFKLDSTFPRKPTACPNAEEFYKRILSIPIYPTLTNKEQSYIIKKIREGLK